MVVCTAETYVPTYANKLVMTSEFLSDIDAVMKIWIPTMGDSEDKIWNQREGYKISENQWKSIKEVSVSK